MTDKTQPPDAEITAPISADLRRLPGLSEQDTGLLEQASSMLEGLHNDERNRGNCSTAEGAACNAHAVRRLAVQLLQAAPPAPAVPEIAANALDLLPPMGIRNDRDMLNYLMGAFNSEVHYCERCGHDEDTKDMDSASFLREYLAAAPAQAVAVPTDAELLALNVGEQFFSESPSKYPEYGHGTQYHAGAPGVLAFARAAICLAATPAQAKGEGNA